MWIFFQPFRSLLRRAYKRAFTLIELLVVVAVITIITALILVNQGKFDSSTLLRSLAYSVALSMRQAQLYGTSVRGFTQSGTTRFAPAYGVSISSGDLTHYYLFADLNGNGVMDTSPTDERLSTSGSSLVAIGQGYSISGFCATRIADGVQECYPGVLGASAWLSIDFRRPNPDGCFATNLQPTACAPGGTPYYSGTYLTVKSAAGSDFRAIKITNTGEITVCKLNVAPPTC